MRVWLQGADEGLLPADGDSGGGLLLVPGAPEELASHYDLTVGRPRAQGDLFATFERWLAGAAAARGLTCALLHDGTVHEACDRLAHGTLSIGFHLDCCARWHCPANPYARLAQAVADAGGSPVNVPGRARLFTDRAACHAELVAQGLGVPDTVVVRPWKHRLLTPAERVRLRLEEPGARVFLKPAHDFGNRVLCTDRTDPEGVALALDAVREHDGQDTYLIQREVRCPRLWCDDGRERPACWRVFGCLDELIPCWWSDEQQPSYRRLTRGEWRRLRLRPVLAYAAALARLSGLAWFSTDLCLSEGPELSRCIVHTEGRAWPVVAVDYGNDRCDVDVQSRRPEAPPDAVVRHVAERFADAAWLCGPRKGAGVRPRSSY